MAGKFDPQIKYMAANVRRMSFDFNRRTDADVIEQLEKQPNRTGYVKKLVRDDIEREKRDK